MPFLFSPIRGEYLSDASGAKGRGYVPETLIVIDAKGWALVV